MLQGSRWSKSGQPVLLRHRPLRSSCKVPLGIRVRRLHRIPAGTVARGQGPSDYLRDAQDQELNRSRSDRELIDHVVATLPSQPKPGGIQAAPAARVLESGWQLCRLGINREITGGQAPPRQRRCAYVRRDRTGQASKRNERGMLSPTA